MIIRASPIATNKTKDDGYRWIDFQHSQGQILPALHLPDIQDRGAYNCVRLFSKMIRSRSSAIIRIQLVQSSEFRPITWISLISLKPPGIPSSFEGGYKMITPAQFMPALQFQSSRGAAESKTAQPEVAGWLEYEEEGAWLCAPPAVVVCPAKCDERREEDDQNKTKKLRRKREQGDQSIIILIHQSWSIEDGQL